MTQPPIITYKNGQQESIPFPDLDVVELQQFIEFLVAGRTPDIIALNAKRNLEWVKSLKLECYCALAKFCVGKNFPMAMAIAESDPIAGLKVGPMLLQMGAFLGAMPSSAAPSEISLPTPSSGAASGPSSPTPPGPTVAAEATGTKS